MRGGCGILRCMPGFERHFWKGSEAKVRCISSGRETTASYQFIQKWLNLLIKMDTCSAGGKAVSNNKIMK